MTKWTPVHEQNKVARKPCLRLATAHGTCGFANGRPVNCNKIRYAVTVTFMLDISEKDLVKLCLLFYNVIR